VTGDEQDARTLLAAVSGSIVSSSLAGGFGAWAEDSSLLITSAKASSCGAALLIYQASDGSRLLCRPTPGQTSAELSPNSRFLALFSEPAGLRRTPAFIGTMTIVDLTTGSEQVLSDDLRGFGGACLEWSPDSRFVLVGVCEGI
jgi:hypothetical protein